MIYYAWTLHFETGETLRQQPGRRMDPNNLPAEIGQPAVIRLIPYLDKKLITIAEDAPDLFVRIPPTARPVYHRFHSINQAGKRGLRYRIGWRVGHARTMISIDPKTLNVSLDLDGDG